VEPRIFRGKCGIRNLSGIRATIITVVGPSKKFGQHEDKERSTGNILKKKMY